MPDGDQRIEVLEDEMKVLKGEVSRTLVDLRALLMSEESPLMLGGLLKRVKGSEETMATISTQVNMALASEPAPIINMSAAPAAPVAMAAPAAPPAALAAPPAAPDQEPSALAAPPSQEPSALAELPGLGSLEMPDAPGAPPDAAPPSQGDEVPTAASPLSAPAAGDISPPGAATEPAADPGSAEEEEGDEERAHLQEQQLGEEIQRALRTRQRETEREEDEDRERRNRRKDQEREEDDSSSRNGRHDSERESEMEEELDRFPLQSEGRDEKMESLSNSFPSANDSEDGLADDLESDGGSVFGEGALDQAADNDGDSIDLDEMDPDASHGESDRGQDDEYEADEQIEGQDPEYDLDDAPYMGSEDEIDDGYAARHNNGHADDRDENLGDPPELVQPEFGPEDNFDSHEYQEEPKINGNNGSRRPRRPDAGRRAYEDSYDDSYYEDRHQEFGREPQSPPRPQRMSRPIPDGRGDPRGRRPAQYDYGYAPNGGNRQWGQPPAGHQQWPAPQEWTPEPSPMDLNLVSSLVRWASLAKNRVGEKRLSDIIELYVESRSATPGLKDALTHIASIVDDQPPESGQTAQETMDLIAHLHGILTAAIPVPEVPRIRSQISFVAGSGKANGNDNGDW